MFLGLRVKFWEFENDSGVVFVRGFSLVRFIVGSIIVVIIFRETGFVGRDSVLIFLVSFDEKIKERCVFRFRVG